MEHSKLAKIFKALANEQRLKIFKMICNCHGKSDDQKKSCCSKGVKNSFTKACDCLSLSRSTVSHHITVLQNAGLLSCKRDGQSMICTVNNEYIQAISDFLELK
jgi:ArsR family transcriptional regulator